MDFDRKIITTLEKLDLSPIQSTFYLALLKSGPSQVSKIAATLKINRTNSYVIVDKLKELGLVSEVNKPAGKILYAQSHEAILEALDKKQKELQALQVTINNVADTFKQYLSEKSNSGPRIKTYQSKHGLNELVTEMLNEAESSGEIRLFTNQESEKVYFSKKKHDEFIRTRVEKDISIKVLAVHNSAGLELKKSDEKYLRQTKILPDKFEFSSEIYLYSNKIAMIDCKDEIVSVVIESEELSKIQTQMFEVIWFNL